MAVATCVPELEFLRLQWDGDVSSQLGLLASRIDSESWDHNPMYGKIRKLNQREYPKLLLFVGYQLGLAKAQGKTFDEWVSSVEEELRKLS
jgi:hypothetical protein